MDGDPICLSFPVVFVTENLCHFGTLGSKNDDKTSKFLHIFTVYSLKTFVMLLTLICPRKYT